MTENEKQLLLKDLCTRLPYGVVIHTYYNKSIDIKCTGCNLFTNTVNLDIPNDDEAKVYVENVRPYLRPMSSMTTKERRYLLKFGTVGMDENDKVFDVYPYGMERTMSVIDFLNANHFDYRELIPMGLALEAPEGMYKTE